VNNRRNSSNKHRHFIDGWNTKGFRETPHYLEQDGSQSVDLLHT
jgi:hypothetical protein